MSHLGVCVLSLYDNTDIGKTIKHNSDTDQNELILNKSFWQDTAPHLWFYEEVFNFGLELLGHDLPDNDGRRCSIFK
jgi:hypothetical protein